MTHKSAFKSHLTTSLDKIKSFIIRHDEWAISLIVAANLSLTVLVIILGKNTNPFLFGVMVGCLLGFVFQTGRQFERFRLRQLVDWNGKIRPIDLKIEMIQDSGRSILKVNGEIIAVREDPGIPGPSTPAPSIH